MYKILAKTLFVAKKIIYLPSCHSTNEVASKLLETNGVQEGTVVITNDQTNGKGQRGNSWEADKGKNLTFSLILKPQFILVCEQFNLNILISLGITDALNKIQDGFTVKWPNDIYYHNSKIAGILIQNNIKGKTIDTSIVGIGININQQLFQEQKAQSLSQVTGKIYDLQEVLNTILSCIELRYLELKNGYIGRLEKDYKNRMYRFGETHLYRAEETFRGTIIGITKEGQLEIDTGEGVRKFLFKEVEFLNDAF